MLRGMSAREFNEWRAYADLEPFDEARSDLRAASIVQALLNTRRPKGKPPYKLQDCMLRFGVDAEPQQQDPEKARQEIRRTMDVLMMIFNTPTGPTPKKRAQRTASE